MPFQPQRTYDVKWAFSNKKQADYATLVANNDLNQHISVIGADVAELSRTSYSNDKQYGKGHEFPTLFRELTREMKLARTMDLSSLMAGWAAAFRSAALHPPSSACRPSHSESRVVARRAMAGIRLPPPPAWPPSR